MTKDRPTEIEMIPIEHITVLNPRSRGQVKFRQIVENIGNIGLKKPITVTPRRSRNGTQQYNLVCGQGRLEAFQALGQREVPCFVIDATKDEVMLMSLAENLARRVRSAPELMAGIATLKDQGYTHAEIAKKTDLKAHYVGGILRLLNKGEERLLRAVEKEEVPISMAITIATSDDADVQRALLDAYQKNALRNKDLMKARRLVEQRRARGKRIKTHGRKRKGRLNGDDVLEAFEKETARQRILIRQARQCETRLRFVVESVRRLLADDAFAKVLRAEELHKLPKFLAEHVNGKREAS